MGITHGAEGILLETVDGKTRQLPITTDEDRLT
jgi:hypothetical protein